MNLFFLVRLGVDNDSMRFCKWSGHKLTMQAFVFPTYNRTSWRDDAIGEKLYYSDWQQQGSWAVEVLRKVVIFSSLNRMKRRVRRRRKIRFPYKTIIWKENVLYCQLEMHAFVVFYAPVGMQPRATCRLRLLISMGSFHSIKSPVGPSLAGRGVPISAIDSTSCWK